MKAPDSQDPAVAYDAPRIARFFDALGEEEWLRLESDAAQKISFHLHRRLLERHVKRGDEVLEIGAGPGRFTLELLRLGAMVTVTDLSPVQLELNRTRIAETGPGAIAEWRIVDVTNLADFEDSSFDGTLALGGPLSYVLDRRDQAVDEMVRVTRSKGYVAVSVMSRAGAFRKFLSGLSTLYESGDAETLEVIDRSVTTGNLVDPKIQTEDHYMHLFSAAELRSLLETHGLEKVQMSSANFVTVQNEDWLDRIEESSDFWRFVVLLEERFAAENGALDGGTHIIAVARKTG